MSFSKARREIQKKDLRDMLAIATNPHLKSENQRDLWQRFAPDVEGMPKRKSILTPELRAQGMAIQAELDRERNAV